MADVVGKDSQARFILPLPGCWAFLCFHLHAFSWPLLLALLRHKCLKHPQVRAHSRLLHKSTNKMAAVAIPMASPASAPLSRWALHFQCQRWDRGAHPRKHVESSTLKAPVGEREVPGSVVLTFALAVTVPRIIGVRRATAKLCEIYTGVYRVIQG